MDLGILNLWGNLVWNFMFFLTRCKNITGHFVMVGGVALAPGAQSKNMYKILTHFS